MPRDSRRIVRLTEFSYFLYKSELVGHPFFSHTLAFSPMGPSQSASHTRIALTVTLHNLLTRPSRILVRSQARAPT